MAAKEAEGSFDISRRKAEGLSVVTETQKQREQSQNVIENKRVAVFKNETEFVRRDFRSQG